MLHFQKEMLKQQKIGPEKREVRISNAMVCASKKRKCLSASLWILYVINCIQCWKNLSLYKLHPMLLIETLELISNTSIQINIRKIITDILPFEKSSRDRLLTNEQIIIVPSESYQLFYCYKFWGKELFVLILFWFEIFAWRIESKPQLVKF